MATFVRNWGTKNRSTAGGLVCLFATIGCGTSSGDGEQIHSLSQAQAVRQAWVPAGSAPSGRYIVMLNGSGNAGALARGVGVKPTSVFSRAINGFAADLPGAAVTGLGNHPNVLSVTPVRSVQAYAQQIPTGLTRIGGNASGSTPSVDVNVAVIDTGVMDSPDLNVVGRVDCVSSGSCVSGGLDGYGHGSHVAGIIGAIDDDGGVAGVAPGAPLHSVKVLDDDGYGTTESVIRGLDWVADNAVALGIKVANMSLGGLCGQVRGRWIHLAPCDDQPCGQTTDPEHAAICAVVAAGVTVVVAAGNDQLDTKYASPGAYNEVITVSALADFDGAPGGTGSGTFTFSSCTESVDDSFACFSNFGADVDLMAPGVGILSTTPEGLQAWSGTSMAAPYVAGAAALFVASNPLASPASVLDALLTASEANPCAVRKIGGACADDGDSLSESLVSLAIPLACNEAADCDDGDACNGAEDCNDGACLAGTPLDCDDSNACTTDSCENGACTHGFVSCEDGNVCTDDSCDPVSGCNNTANTAICDDGDACTSGDSCSEGQCQPGTLVCEPPSCQSSGDACSNDGDCCSSKCRKGVCRG